MVGQKKISSFCTHMIYNRAAEGARKKKMVQHVGVDGTHWWAEKR
jgi:hypothetical protein